jgi:hypothetical protein
MSDNNDQFDEQQWSSLISDWQSQPVTPVETKGLLKKIRRRSRNIWLTTAFDIIAVVGCLLTGFGFFFFSENNLDKAIFCWVSSIWGAFIFHFELRVRKGTWRLHDIGSANIIDFSLKRCEAAIKIGKLFTPAVLSFLPLVLMWQAFRFWYKDEFKWQFTLFMLALTVVVVITSKVIIRRKVKELESLKALQSQTSQKV